jgi:hypothetical protein
MGRTSIKLNVGLIQSVTEIFTESGLNVSRFQIMGLFSNLIATNTYLYSHIYKAGKI